MSGILKDAFWRENDRRRDFKVALKNLPPCVVGNLDLLAHKTIADLRYIVKHELDMYEEGQETDVSTADDINACEQFLKTYR